MQDSQQYDRTCKLIIGNNSGSGLDLSKMRITFDIKKGDSQTPNSSVIRVYNLSKTEENEIQKEFTTVLLQAGYQTNFGTIFSGNIKKVSRGKEAGKDTYIDILVGDGDKSYNFSITNKTLEAGCTQKDQVNESINSMTLNGLTKGYIPNFDDNPLPRGKVMYGMARHYLRQSAKSTNTTWSIQDTKVQMLERTGLLPTQAVLLNYKTGLIGDPKINNGGIELACLLNPLIKIGGSIKLDNSSIQDSDVGNDDNDDDNSSLKNSDGIYRVLTVEYKGDTHGSDWLCNISCLSVDSTAKQGNQVQVT